MKIIGISGLARSGKDHFCQLLTRELYSLGYGGERFALADELKKNINPFFSSEFGIDIFNCSDSAKSSVRPLMVSYGMVWRLKTEGKHWTKILEEKIKMSECDVAIITDIRYNVYDQDEVHWLKEHMNGILVHLTRYDVGENGEKKYYDPPNEEEALNDPLVAAQADYKIEWQSGVCDHHVKKFAKFLEPLI